VRGRYAAAHEPRDDVVHRALRGHAVQVIDDEAGAFAGELERNFTADAATGA
jgi:hypothetical protein